MLVKFQERTIPMPKTSTIIHKSTNSTYDYKSTNIHKKPKIQRKDKNGVPLCPGMAVIWWSSQESLQWQDEWIPTSKPQKEKKYMLSKCPFKKKKNKKKEKKKKRKGVYTRMNCSIHNCSQFILVGGICWTLKIRKLIWSYYLVNFLNFINKNKILKLNALKISKNRKEIPHNKIHG